MRKLMAMLTVGMLLPSTVLALNMNIGWDAYKYETGRLELTNNTVRGMRWHDLYSYDLPRPEAIPYNSNSGFLLRDFRVEDTARIELELSPELDTHYYASLFHWGPIGDAEPYENPPLPPTPPFSLDKETRAFEPEQPDGHMYVLFKPEEGRRWTRDLKFTLAISDSVSDGGTIGVGTRIEHWGRFNVAPVPEPATITLLGIAMAAAGVAAVYRRKD